MNGLLWIHIAAGTLSVASGVAALVLRKGERGHREAGTVFVVSMVVMALTAAVLGSDVGNVVAGGLTIYMVGTGWMTMRRKGKGGGLLEIASCVAAFGFALSGIWSAVLIVSGAKEADNPYIVFVTLVLSGGLALAGAGDLSVVLRRRISSVQRIARHLWRMCFGLIIALGSFAAQGSDALPSALRGPALVFGPMLFVLLVMFFWLVRVRFTRWPSPTTALR